MESDNLVKRDKLAGREAVEELLDAAITTLVDTQRTARTKMTMTDLPSTRLVEERASGKSAADEGQSQE